MAILAALFLGAVGFFVLGVGGAIWMSSLYGSNSGGSEMSTIFTLGPLGCLAGILLGVGLVFHFSGGPAGWAKGLMIGGASLAGLAAIVLAGLVLAHPHSPPPRPETQEERALRPIERLIRLAMHEHRQRGQVHRGLTIAFEGPSL